MELSNYQLEENANPLILKQLIYTSFSERGFTLLTSKNVPLLVQQSFTQRFIQSSWDPYLPPTSDYRAGYLFQMPPETAGTLFGWLYHDGYDEIGRSDIPYFIAYYLPGVLQPTQLSVILTCLEQGPISWIDRSNSFKEITLETLKIEDVRNNKPVRQGVVIPTAIRVQSFEAMHSQVLMDYFFANTNEQQSLVNVQSHPQNTQLEHKLEEKSEPQMRELVMNLIRIEDILQELISKPIAIHGAVLVSSEGLAITKPMGINENVSGMLAGTMIYLAQNTQATLNWQEIELVSMRAPEGYIMLSRCNADIYLLIQSGKVPVGLLEGEVNQTVVKLRLALNTPDDSRLINQAGLTPQNDLPIEGNIAESFDHTNEITYRGRRAIS